MGKWTTEIYDASGNRLADLTGKALSRQIVKTRNRSDVITVKYNLDDIKRLCVDINTTVQSLFAVNINEIRMKRNGTVLSAGQIVRTYPSIDEDNRTIEVKATGWLDLLGFRLTPSGYVFSQIDAGQIAWTAINDTQALTNGNFGITEGTIQASQLRDRQYDYKNIKDLIIELSEVINGFDLEVTWDKVFNVYYPKIGTMRSDILLTYPGNIKSIAYANDGLAMANEVVARGSGTGGSSIIGLADDLIAQAKYKLRQDFLEQSDVSDVGTLVEHAQSEVLLQSHFAAIPDITLRPGTDPEYGTYGMGDLLPIQVTKDLEVFGDINDYFRVDSTTLDIDENDDETVRLQMMR